MKEHLNDGDIVALVLLPDDAPDAKLHLADCPDCNKRFVAAEETLERERQKHAGTVESKDATFWKRQELSIMREVARQGRSSSSRRTLAAAALLTVALGGFWFGRATVEEPAAETQTPGPVAEVKTPTASTQNGVEVPATAASTNPWESESLEEFQAVVDWESWVDDDGKDQGTI